MSDAIWGREEAFWTGSAAEAIGCLDPAALMVFGPTGILEGEAIPPTLRDAPRWDEVWMKGRHLLRSDDIVVLAYLAEAQRGGQDYRALCSSTWIRRDAGWRLIAHQQTPM